VALVQAKWQAQGGLSSINTVNMVGGNVAVTDDGFPEASDGGILAAMGCSSSPCQGVSVSHAAPDSTWTPQNAGTCTVTYNATAGTVTANNTTTNCQ
jgi:hypothetical protein